MLITSLLHPAFSHLGPVSMVIVHQFVGPVGCAEVPLDANNGSLWWLTGPRPVV